MQTSPHICQIWRFNYHINNSCHTVRLNSFWNVNKATSAQKCAFCKEETNITIVSYKLVPPLYYIHNIIEPLFSKQMDVSPQDLTEAWSRDTRI